MEITGEEHDTGMFLSRSAITFMRSDENHSGVSYFFELLVCIKLRHIFPTCGKEL